MDIICTFMCNIYIYMYVYIYMYTVHIIYIYIDHYIGKIWVFHMGIIEI